MFVDLRNRIVKEASDFLHTCNVQQFVVYISKGIRCTFYYQYQGEATMYSLHGFSENALEVMIRAQDEALTRNSDYVHMWHVLIGILGVKGGSGYALLEASGADILDIERFAHVQEMTLVPTADMGRITWGPDVKKMIEFARDEAKALQQTHIGTEHVLVALLQVLQERVGDLLAHHVRITPNDIREKLSTCKELA